MTAANLRPDGAIRILRNPRILGYVFNPLTVYYCYRRSGAPSAFFTSSAIGTQNGTPMSFPSLAPPAGAFSRAAAKSFTCPRSPEGESVSVWHRGGAAALQIITMADASFQSYRRRIDFFQRYVFLVGMLPSLNTSAATSAGIMSSRTSGLGLVALV
jgi:hypothetical protein